MSFGCLLDIVWMSFGGCLLDIVWMSFGGCLLKVFRISFGCLKLLDSHNKHQEPALLVGITEKPQKEHAVNMSHSTVSYLPCIIPPFLTIPCAPAALELQAPAAHHFPPFKAPPL